VVAAVLVMLRLGLWQWHRANSPSGGIQNYAYAGQWPLFAVFAIVLWIRTIVEDSRREPGAPPTSPSRPMPTSDAPIEHYPGLIVGLTAPEPLASPDQDPELAAWNARLAALNAASTAAEGRRR
jgi:DNA-binding transcriptional regulator of glucitol operon